MPAAARHCPPLPAPVPPENRDLGWWTTRAWRRQLTAARSVEQELRARWDELAEPERTPLDHALHDIERDAATLHRQADEHRRWIRSLANVINRIDNIAHELSRDGVDVEAMEMVLGVSHDRTGPTNNELGIEL